MTTTQDQNAIYLNLFQRVLTQSQVDNIYRWIEALESGSYKQGSGQLAEGEGVSCKYCCLGVANEVCHLGQDPRSGTLNRYEVVGLANCFGEFDTPKQESATSLIKLNDGCRWSFKEIANLLRDQLKFSTTTQETN